MTTPETPCQVIRLSFVDAAVLFVLAFALGMLCGGFGVLLWGVR